jgi:hypothetical protein
VIVRLGPKDSALVDRVMTYTGSGRARFVFISEAGPGRSVDPTDYLAKQMPARQIVGVYDNRACSTDIAEDLIETRKLLKQPTL